jgi:hypothetical protein
MGLERWARRLGPVIAPIAMLWFIPALFAGPFADDDLLLLALRGEMPGPTGPLSAYRFLPDDPAYIAQLRRVGLTPWWAHPDLVVQFFRPLTSLTFALDAALVPRGEGFGALAHLHTLLWVGALSLAARRLYARLLLPETAAVAALLHALTGALAISGAWISARHTLVGGLFALMAVERHLAWRAGEARAGAAWAWFGVGLLASESVLGAAAWVLAFELWGARDAMRTRLWATIPWAGASLAFVVLYRLAGFGSRHSGSYLDPALDPLGVAATMGLRALVLAATGLLAVPAELATTRGVAQGMAGVGVGALALCAALTWALRDRLADRDLRALRWILPAGLLATVPALLGIVGGRLLVVGGPALLAWVAALAVATGRERAPLAVRLGVGLLLLPALVSGPLQRAAVAHQLGVMERAVEQVAASAQKVCAPDADVLLLGASDYGIAAYAVSSQMRARGSLPWRSYRALTLVEDDVTITRTGAGSVEVRTASRPLYEADFERVYTDAPPPADVPIDAGAFTVTPHADLRSFVLTFPEGVVPPTACFVRFDGEGMQPLLLGAVGESVGVPRAIGPMER